MVKIHPSYCSSPYKDLVYKRQDIQKQVVKYDQFIEVYKYFNIYFSPLKDILLDRSLLLDWLCWNIRPDSSLTSLLTQMKTLILDKKGEQIAPDLIDLRLIDTNKNLGIPFTLLISTIMGSRLSKIMKDQDHLYMILSKMDLMSVNRIQNNLPQLLNILFKYLFDDIQSVVVCFQSNQFIQKCNNFSKTLLNEYNCLNKEHYLNYTQLNEERSRTIIMNQEVANRQEWEHIFLSNTLFADFRKIYIDVYNKLISTYNKDQQEVKGNITKYNIKFQKVRSWFNLSDNKFKTLKKRQKYNEILLIGLREDLDNIIISNCLICYEMVEGHRKVKCRTCGQKICHWCFRRLYKCPFCRARYL